MQLKDLDAYRGRPVLITGADGFVGSHLADALVNLGAEVHALVRRPKALRNLGHLQERLSLHAADVRNYGQVRQALEPLGRARGLIIFHLAAQAHVGESWIQPEITLETNVLGTQNLLRAVLDLKLDLHCFDYAGTSEEYGKYNEALSNQYRRDAGGSIILDETSPLNPQSIYASSKVAADFLCRNYFAAFGLPVMVTRMFNNFGPRQSPRFITASVITQALKQPIIEVGHVEARRDFTYISDGIQGHLLAALHGSPGEVYIFGQGRNIAIADWIKQILQVGNDNGVWPEREAVVKKDRLRPGRTDEADLLADATKLQNLTGWQPTVGLGDGILSTIRWYSENIQ
ncbi:MAG TPA: GDP-mannose 4,6-dehydratase [bacterium]